MYCREYAEMMQELKGLELAEYEEELRSERIDWKEYARFFQWQILLSKKKSTNRCSMYRNQIRKARANLWSGQRKRQGVDV